MARRRKKEMGYTVSERGLMKISVISIMRRTKNIGLTSPIDVGK